MLAFKGLKTGNIDENLFEEHSLLIAKELKIRPILTESTATTCQPRTAGVAQAPDHVTNRSRLKGGGGGWRALRLG